MADALHVADELHGADEFQGADELHGSPARDSLHNGNLMPARWNLGFARQKKCTRTAKSDFEAIMSLDPFSECSFWDRWLPAGNAART